MCDSITAGTNLTLTSGKTVIFSAKNSTELLPGFEVAVGSSLIVENEGCDCLLKSTQNESLEEITSDKPDILYNIKVYPNPTEGNLMLETEVEEVNYNVFIYDIQGRKIFSEIIKSNSYAINISNQPKGIYFLQLDANGKQETIKIILQ